MNGALYVMTTGLLMRQLWYADRLVFLVLFKWSLKQGIVCAVCTPDTMQHKHCTLSLPMCIPWLVLASTDCMLYVPVGNVFFHHHTCIIRMCTCNTHRFGSGSNHIWLDDVVCEGTENFIQDCQHSPFGENNCNHQEDAGVICQRKGIHYSKRL